MKNYINYHSHKMYTNIIVADSPTKYEAYIDRALELNQSVITSVEHGFQGNYWLLNLLIEQKNNELEKRRKDGEDNVPKNLKMVFGAEAYWVRDRHPKVIIDDSGKEKTVNDNSNCHIIILAKTELGRRKLNLALSKANEDGMFNGRPRLDLELLLELPKDDVFVTTSCLAYWNKYDDIEEITELLHNHFGDNFMLEVQNHDTDLQRQINKRVLKVADNLGIKIIAGMDTHVIDGVKDTIKRDKILEYKKMKYEDEEGWFLDYPSYEVAFERFEKQGVLSISQITEALDNTNIIEQFGRYNLNKDVKLPTLYLGKTQGEKDIIFKNIINKEWKAFKENENIPQEEVPMYLEGIRYEVNEVINTKMTDYFLLHYVGLKRGVKNGGIITKRGRGSGVGFFINTLLGFSKVDRFKAPIKLYPERFLTADRILKSKSLPDIDNNISEQEPFVDAFKELLGEHGIYPMIAFGALKKSSAIKLYMGAEGIEASIQNEVTKQLQEYDKAIKHCESDEEKDSININNYISKEYSKYVELSKPYQGIIVQKSSHPCAYLLLNGDIREEIGLFRCESASTGKSVLTACIEGIMADTYKYLKTDLLIVDVVGLTEAIWDRIGLPSPTNNELEKILASKNGEKAWEMYEKGYTLCINQCEKEGTKNKCMKYKMKNTAELSAFVAGIRPAFSSLLSNFLERKPYTTGVAELDNILKDSFHYMLYQESLMAYMAWLGIEMKETYDVIKKISKKKFSEEALEDLRIRCKNQWIKNVGNDKGFDETWKVMNDAVAYAFNSAHSYCVGNDGAEIAYTKAYYPYETYEVCLNWFDKKKNKEKVSSLKEEMKIAFGISVGEIKWGVDNRKFTLDKKNKCIHPSLTSIKKMGKNVAEELYLASINNNFNSFYELLKYIVKNTSVNSAMLDILIRLDYFKDFAKREKILKFIEYYNLLEGKKAPKKSTISDKVKDFFVIKAIENCSVPTNSTYSKFDSERCLDIIWELTPNTDIVFKDSFINKKDILGYIDYKNSNLDKRYVFIGEIDTKYTPKVDTYCLNNGVTCKCKISKSIFKNNPISENDFIYIHSMQKKFGHKKVGETTDKKGNTKPLFEVDETKQEWWINSYSIISDMDEVIEDLDI